MGRIELRQEEIYISAPQRNASMNGPLQSVLWIYDRNLPIITQLQGFLMPIPGLENKSHFPGLFQAVGTLCTGDKYSECVNQLVMQHIWHVHQELIRVVFQEWTTNLWRVLNIIAICRNPTGCRKVRQTKTGAKWIYSILPTGQCITMQTQEWYEIKSTYS